MKVHIRTIPIRSLHAGANPSHWWISPKKVCDNLLLMALAVCLLFGCTTVAPPEGGSRPPGHRRGVEPIADLEADLATLLGYRDKETRLLARAILSGTDHLARQYRVQSPPLWHNFLINIGLRERGLCCHWTQDLLLEIEALRLRKYHAVWGVSRHGTWREHSSVVITAVGKGFETGLVLDPWRNAGDLYWINVREDSYAWHPHPGAGGAARIRCR